MQSDACSEGCITVYLADGHGALLQSPDMDPSILDFLRSTDVAVRVAIVSSTTVATKAL